VKITAIVLTYNEEIHLARCLESIHRLTDDIYVVDSFSTDRTLEIAGKYGAKLLQRVWDNNHSNQVNWALEQLPLDTQWVMRIDADEILTAELVDEIKAINPSSLSRVNGIFFGRRIKFQGKQLRFGGLGNISVLRLFRFGFGKSESRWMDEHIRIQGNSISLRNSIIDENLNSITWWISKHNNYASREAVDLLNLKYKLLDVNQAHLNAKASGIDLKRWIKENIYSRLPGGLRALSYFIYRYLFLLGMMDGKSGATFHVLQAFWYRFLVDVKVFEVEQYAKKNQVDLKIAISKVFGIHL
jgi:glycosyltransferase involved in cell wall biosynthesis